MHFNPIYNHSLNKTLFNFYRLFSGCLVCCVSFCSCSLVSVICCFSISCLSVIAVLERDNCSVIFLVDKIFDLVRF